MASKCSKENLAPSPKKKRLSLQLKKPKEPDRVRFPLASKQQIEESKKAAVPKNTGKSTAWALRLFESWSQQRNERCEEKVPEGILLTEKMEDLCHWLCVCVSEVRKEDGAEYTPRSISQFVAGLQRYINERKPAPVRLADPRQNSTERLVYALISQSFASRKLYCCNASAGSCNG